MEFLRTPDERFAELADWPYEPKYVQVDDTEGGHLRMHYIDEGPADADVVLMLHGEPSWSYLYRNMIKGVVEAGYRAVAIDLIGFGRSDKPTKMEDYTYARHFAWLRSAVEQIGLKDVTLFCQDWGGLLGLRLVGQQPDLFTRVIAANTFLPIGKPAGEAFIRWRDYSQKIPEFGVSRIIQGATALETSEAALAAYDAPFPDESYKAGARIFPTLVPISPDDAGVDENLKAWETLKTFDKPFLTAFSDKDPVTAGGDKLFQKLIPGCAGQNHTTIQDGGHFLQEDQGPRLAEIIVAFMKA